jgi:hypothetical protein
MEYCTRMKKIKLLLPTTANMYLTKLAINERNLTQECLQNDSIYMKPKNSQKLIYVDRRWSFASCGVTEVHISKKEVWWPLNTPH